MKLLTFSLYFVVQSILWTPSADAAILLNDTFSDNERETQNLPNSAKWVTGAHAFNFNTPYQNTSAESGALVVDHIPPGGSFNSASFVATWAHFSPAGTPVGLQIGETMKLSFTVAFDGWGGTIAGLFRFALFDSGGSRVLDDFANSNEPGISSGSSFSGWRGYEIQSSLAAIEDLNVMTLARKRTGDGNGLFSSTEWSELASSVNLAPRPYSLTDTLEGSLSLTRGETGIEVSGSLGGLPVFAAIDTENPVTNFDSVAFFGHYFLEADIILDNVKVEVIPEPTLVSIVLLSAAGFIARRRK